jgi:NAD(P)-dependent dehydrogenase (short-subunit alcohol dehydrogenase family)
MSVLSGRVALVTGGSSGIGRGAALRLAAQGASVAVHGLDLAEAESVAAELRGTGAETIGLAGDVSSADAAASAARAAVDAFGRLDILVAAAGIQRYGDVVATTESTWDEVFDVNVKGVFLAVKAAVPYLRESDAGSVVIVSSVQAIATQTDVVAYTAGKGALLSLTRALAVDEARYGVRVNSVSPGSVDTPMLRTSAAMWSDGTEAGVAAVLENWGTAHALGRIATVEEVGEVIAFLAGSGAAFVTGADFRVDGGLLARIAAPLPATAKTIEG